MDWGHSLLGRLLGSEYQVIYFFSALTWSIFLSVHLFSIPEEPLCKARSTTDASASSALRPLGSHSSGYGALSRDPGASIPDIRPRSFSALGEANSVTSSAKQPNKKVCDEVGGKYRTITERNVLLIIIIIIKKTNSPSSVTQTDISNCKCVLKCVRCV